MGKKLLLLAGTLVLCAGLAELTVRMLYPEFGFPVHERRLFTEYDPVLGWRKIPNFRGIHVDEEYRVVERINSKGLRGPEIDYAKPPGVTRILVLGDSFAEGYTVAFPQLFSEVMERSLEQELGRDVQVVNAGTGGYSTDQELLFFRTEGRRYDPDLTILLFYANDLRDNVRSAHGVDGRGQKPLFVLRDGELVLAQRPRPTWTREELLAEHGIDNSFVPWRKHGWFLYRLARHALSRGEASLVDELPSRGRRTAPRGPEVGEIGADARQRFPAADRETLPQWEITEALIARLREETEAAGSPLLLFYVPERDEIYDREMRPILKSSDQEAMLGGIARRHGIDFVPTVRLYQAQALNLDGSGRHLYFRKDPHWNVDGHRVAGLALAQAIAASCARYDLCEERAASDR